MIYLVVSMTLVSCQSDVTYAESQSISNAWSDTDTLMFSPVIEEVNAAQDLYLWVRHDKKYKYSNVWVRVESELDLDGDADSNGAGRLFEIKLADKTGKWLGTCSQSMCTAKLLIKSGLTVTEKKSFKLSVVQYMREENLANVKDVGVELVRAND
jgi:gliding motility-associated lipoprotein GldH